jgi:hypothetical protein
MKVRNFIIGLLTFLAGGLFVWTGIALSTLIAVIGQGARPSLLHVTITAVPLLIIGLFLLWWKSLSRPRRT